jgi:hypothetical protein
MAMMYAPQWPLARLLRILDEARARDGERVANDARAPREVPVRDTDAAKCDLYARKAICHLRRADEHLRSREKSRGRRAADAHYARAREYARKAVCIRCGERATVRYMQR